MCLTAAAECRICKEDEEITKHILCDFLALVWTRRKQLHMDTAVLSQIAYSW